MGSSVFLPWREEYPASLVVPPLHQPLDMVLPLVEASGSGLDMGRPLPRRGVVAGTPAATHT